MTGGTKSVGPGVATVALAGGADGLCSGDSDALARARTLGVACADAAADELGVADAATVGGVACGGTSAEPRAWMKK
jgi:hypothetical protein